MSIQTTYSQARANFAKLWDRAVNDREAVYIERRGSEPVALVAASELRAIEETAHLLRSPVNAQRLLQALKRAQDKKGTPQSVDEVKAAAGLTRGAEED